MSKRILICASLLIISQCSYGDNEYFYCGFTNSDGSGQDYAKWGKGTDFKFNKTKSRWEWVSEYSYQYIYPNGRYEQIARVSYFENQRGQCNSKMEAIYKKKLADIAKKYGK